VPLDFIECSQQRPGFPGAVSGGFRPQAQHAVRPHAAGLEPEEGFDDTRAGAGDAAGRRAPGIDLESGRACAVPYQRLADFAAAADGLDLPGERQEVAPVSVGQEQGCQRRVVRCGQSLLETCEPLAYGPRRRFFCPVFQASARLAQ
jgi:hypothetical protein